MKALLAFCLVALMVGLVPCAAQDNEGGRTLVITAGEQPPLIYKNSGIVNLVIEQALLRMGYSVTFEWLPIGRMLALLEQDALDCYITPSNTAAQHNPHVNVLAARGVFFYLKKNAPNPAPSKLEDFAGKRVGTVTNSPLTPLFKKAGILVDEGPFDTMFVKLAAGRVDFVTTADIGGIFTINKLFPGRENEFDFTEFSYTLIGAGLYVKAGPGCDEILNALKAGVEIMKKDGTLSAMLLDAFGPVHAARVFVY